MQWHGTSSAAATRLSAISKTGEIIIQRNRVGPILLFGQGGLIILRQWQYDRLLKARRPALMRPEPKERIAEIVLRHRPVVASIQQRLPRPSPKDGCSNAKTPNTSPKKQASLAFHAAAKCRRSVAYYCSAAYISFRNSSRKRPLKLSMKAF